MPWTFNSAASVANREDAVDTDVTVNLTGLNVGDLVVMLVKWEGADTTVTATIAAEAMTEWIPAVGTQHFRATDNPWASAFYKIGTAQSGSVTVTATFGAARGFKDIVVMTYTPSAGTVALDGSPVSAFGSSTTPASGNMTTTGLDGVAFGLYDAFGNATASQLINGVAREQFVEATVGTKSAIWGLRYSSGFTGQAAATITSVRWGCGILAFNLTGLTTQEGYRWRNDDGTETTATWQAAQDTNVTLAPGTAGRLRMLVDATGDPASMQPKLEFRKTGEADWQPIG